MCGLPSRTTLNRLQEGAYEDAYLRADSVEFEVRPTRSRSRMVTAKWPQRPLLQMSASSSPGDEPYHCRRLLFFNLEPGVR
jgi:hypothetical protein